MGKAVNLMICGRMASMGMGWRPLGLFRRWALGLAVASGLVVLTGCGGGQGGLNVAREAKLSGAVRLEIRERDESSLTSYATRGDVAEQAAIQKAATLLDRPLPLGPRARCLGQYQLRFHFADGKVQEFEYFCQDGTSFLRGDQAFWQGMQIEPTAEFDQAIRSLLAP